MDMDHNFDENQVFLPIAMVRYNDLPILLFVGFGTVAYISVILRTITRAHIIKKFGWDDATMIVSLVSVILLGALLQLTLQALIYSLLYRLCQSALDSSWKELTHSSAMEEVIGGKLG